MSRTAILRWPEGENWGQLSVATSTGEPRFIGFVKLTDPDVRELISRSTIVGDEDMREIRFAVPADEPVPALAAAL